MPPPRVLHLTRRGHVLVTVVTLAALAAGSWALAWRPGAAPDDVTPPAPSASTSPRPSPSPTPPDPGQVRRRDVTPATRWLGDDVAAAVVALAEGLLEEAPVVVVATDAALTPARSVARMLRAPLLPADAPDLDGVLDRLGTRTVVTVELRPSPSPTREAPSSSASSPRPSRPVPPVVAPSASREVVALTVDGRTVDHAPLAEVPVPSPATGRDGPLVLIRQGDPARPLLHIVALAADVSLVPVADVFGEDDRAIARMREGADAPWAVAGTATAWGDVDLDVLAWDVEVARSGAELPGGGLRMFPGRRLVAMYGSPGAASLGILGEQPVDAAIDRARSLAADYAPLVDDPVVPTFEIITTVASGGPEPTGDYSRRVPHEQIEPWVDAAEAAGMYVILDLQPGRTDFLTQAREVEHLLRRPHVGLALDPEWRLRPDQVHLRQIGSVGVAEVQAVADWLADLTRRERLPQKLLLLHQFRLSMLPDIQGLQVPPELAVTIQMDGQGSQPAKDATWQAITTIAPPSDVWFGWKNFYDEDTTLRSPADTLAVAPTPVMISYQ